MCPRSLCAVAVLAAALVAVPALAQQGDLQVRVVDVGAGLCTVTRAPGSGGSHYMVYDAGSHHWQSEHCFREIRDFVDGNRIDLLIVSHPDTDHLSNADELLEEFDVRRIIRTGHERPGTDNWVWFDDTVEAEEAGGAQVTDLRDDDLVPGSRIAVGDAEVVLVAGWHDWPESVGASESRNIISIVARLVYQGRAVLFAGDTAGRSSGDEDQEACEGAERIMADRHNAGEVTLTSNVVIAPHHGADNGSSSCFIEAALQTSDGPVVPRYLVFSAGHVTRYSHPRIATMQRYRTFGWISNRYMFRTDRGDHESRDTHWDDSQGPSGCEDGRADDPIAITIDEFGQIAVEYVNDEVGPCGG